jgi:anti-sigma regulatory factor (Ser/Thr protein kinase)
MRLRIFPTLEAPGEARRRLAPVADRVDATSFSSIRTVISELVTISVLHGATKPIDISLELVDSEIEGVVEDHGPGARALTRARAQKDDSFVLRIVEGLVDHLEPTETSVRFRIAVQPLQAG